MAGMRDDEATNDVEFEVSRLDDRTATPPSEPAAEMSESGDARQYVASHNALESSLRSRLRRRLLQIAMTGLAVALSVAIILTVPNAASQLKAPLRLLAPEPTATLPLGSDIILLAHTVPWGHLRVDGRTDGATDLDGYNGYHSYRLPPGQHTLDYVAAPFHPTHCTVSAPARASDTCKAPSHRALASHPIGEGLRALDMNATLSTMDSYARSKLQTLLENGSPYPAITIEPGMHYLDQKGNVAIARERMMVTLTVEARQPASDTDFDDEGQPCGEFCVQDTYYNSVGWILLVRVGLRWQYMAASGATFTARSTDEPSIATAFVTYSNKSWSLVEGGSITTDACISPSQLERISHQATDAVFNTGAFVEYPPSANGCVLEFSPQNNAGAPPRAQILLRLGVSLAVNADAQRIFPDLPVASAAERAIAQAIRMGEVQ